MLTLSKKTEHSPKDFVSKFSTAGTGTPFLATCDDDIVMIPVLCNLNGSPACTCTFTSGVVEYQVFRLLLATVFLGVATLTLQSQSGTTVSIVERIVRKD